MPYILVTDLLTRFGAEELAQLSDRGTPRRVTAELLTAAATGADISGWSEADVAVVTTAMANINQAIDDAQSVIDGYLSGRYGTPMATPPAAVKRLACDIARYFLFDDHASETVQKRYDASISYLRDVSAGKVSLGAVVEDSRPTGGSVEIVTGGKVFGRSERGL